jgi:hypothetical protein
MKTAFILRLLTLACWFLPFCFFMSMCVGGTYKTAYNKKQAFAYLSEANRETVQEIMKQWEGIKHGVTETNKRSKIDSVRERSFERLFEPFNKEGMEVETADSSKRVWEPIVHNIILPNYYSLSGIGVIVEFKNFTGRVLAGASLFLCLIILLFARFMKKRLKFCLITNQLLLTCFLINGLVIEVDLLYGFWILYLLVMFQLVLSWKVPYPSSRDKS